MQVLFHSLENSLLNLHSVLSDSKVYGCDCDFLPKLAKGWCQHLSAFLLGPGIRFAALLDKSDALVQDLPNHAAEPMSDGPDGGLIAQPRQKTPEHDLKMTLPFFLTAACAAWFSTRPRYLLLWRSYCCGSLRRFRLFRDRSPPKKSIPTAEGNVLACTPTSAMICCAASTPKPGYFRQSHHRLLMRLHGLRDQAVELGDWPVNQLQPFQL
jgi:hypothetical protein